MHMELGVSCYQASNIFYDNISVDHVKQSSRGVQFGVE
jgi:hypothetical protein